MFGKNWFRSSPRLKKFSEPHLHKFCSALTDSTHSLKTIILTIDVFSYFNLKVYKYFQNFECSKVQGRFLVRYFLNCNSVWKKTNLLKYTMLLLSSGIIATKAKTALYIFTLWGKYLKICLISSEITNKPVPSSILSFETDIIFY